MAFFEPMQLRLPFAGRAIPCFKLRDTEVYLGVKRTLCSFTALQVRPLKTLREDIQSWYGSSYYHKSLSTTVLVQAQFVVMRRGA
jgi:hypothetical protein